jgi:hypothetical protein
MKPRPDILNADALLAGAEAQTRLHDYGDDTLPARFRLAADYLKSLGMDAAGERAAASVCLWLLTSRLEVFGDRKRYPIAEERIERPLFVTGEARSGTTLLHALLAVDPDARAPRFWEVMYPSPPPGIAKPDDPRRARADEDWREILRKIPNWLITHPYSDKLGDSLPEDERLWAFDFRAMMPTAWWRVPMGVNFASLPADPRAQYRIHKMMLQHCQYARPKRHWVLKGFHQQRMPELFETYPDARIVWVHRDPVQVVASRIVHMSDMLKGLVGHFDRKDVADQELARARAGYHATLADAALNDLRIHHVRYPDLVADPVGTIRGFYERCDVRFGPETEAAMRDYLRSNRADRYGKFEYSTDVIGLPIRDLHAEFAAYRERFGLEIERPG